MQAVPLAWTPRYALNDATKPTVGQILMTGARFPLIRFSQFGSKDPSDDLLLFAAPARVLAAWAGIPRKAWHIRMLFQRPITPGREADLRRVLGDRRGRRHQRLYPWPYCHSGGDPRRTDRY